MKMSFVASYKIFSISSKSEFKKFVVIRIGANLHDDIRFEKACNALQTFNVEEALNVNSE